MYKLVDSEQYWGNELSHVPNSDTGLVNENYTECNIECISVPNVGLGPQKKVCSRCHIKSCKSPRCNTRLICAKCFCPIDHFFHHHNVCSSQLRNRRHFKSKTGKVLQNCALHNTPLLLGDICRVCDPDVSVYSLDADFKNVKSFGDGVRTKLYDISNGFRMMILMIIVKCFVI